MSESNKSTTQEGKVALVTGAATGIGAALAAGLADNGATVIGADIAWAAEGAGRPTSSRLTATSPMRRAFDNAWPT